MGNNESIRSLRVEGLNVLRKYEHPLIGEVSEVIDTVQQTKHLLRVSTCPDQNQHREELTKLRMRKLKNNKYLVALNHYE